MASALNLARTCCPVFERNFWTWDPRIQPCKPLRCSWRHRLPRSPRRRRRVQLPLLTIDAVLRQAPVRVVTYQERTSSGETVATFQGSQFVESDKKASQPCQIDVSCPNNIAKPYRYMFTTIQQRAQALEKQLVSSSRRLIDSLGLETETEAPLQEQCNFLFKMLPLALDVSATKLTLENSTRPRSFWKDPVPPRVAHAFL